MLNKNNLHSYMDKVVIVNSKSSRSNKNINNNAILIVSDIESEKF